MRGVSSSLSGLRASVSILAFLAILLPAVALPEPVALHGVACFDTSKAVLHNGTVLELPSLKPLAQLEPLDGCDTRGNLLAAWRAGEVRVYRGLEPVFAVRGERAFIGSRFLLVVGGDSVAAYSLYGFEVLRLDRRTVPAAVWVLAAQKAGGKAVALISPTTCRVRMQVESYLLVYDLDLGLWDIHQTGAVSFLAVPSGVVWVKNGTLYHNGRAIGNAPDRLYPVNGFDGYAYTQGDKVIIVAINGSTYTLPLPSGIDLAVSRLSEGFVACSSYQCTCTFNCTGFSAIAYQAFAPPTVTETGTHHLLYARPTLYLLEKPKPGTAPQNGTQPSSQTPASSTQPSNQTPTNAAAPQNATQPTAQPPAGTTTPESSTTPPQNATVPASSTPSIQQNATQPQPGKPSQDASQGFSVLLAIAIIVGIALALAGYTFYKRRYRYVS